MAQALCDTRERYKDYFELLIDEAQKKREPIVRALEYEFPKQGLHGVRDSFMLGDKLLVSPVTEKGAKREKRELPRGIQLERRKYKRYLSGRHCGNCTCRRRDIADFRKNRNSDLEKYFDRYVSNTLAGIGNQSFLILAAKKHVNILQSV